MISIRSGAFETNSSSTHAIIINRSDIISEFIEGKHFLNRITGEIVLDPNIESEKMIVREVANEYIESRFRSHSDDIYKKLFNKEVAFKWGVQRVADDIFDDTNDEDYREYHEYRDSVLNDPAARQVFINKFADKALIRFADMNDDCEIEYNRDTILVDGNNNSFDAISVYGSDSYDFGEWPTR